MAGQDQKLSFLLSGGIDTRKFSELVSPVVQQGSAPDLAVSTNTRLGIIPGTCLRPPTVTPLNDLNADCCGIVPAANGDSTLILLRPQGQNRQLSGVSAGNIPALKNSIGVSSSDQTAYFPLGISRSGALPGGTADTEPVLAYHSTSGEIWIAYLRTDGTSKWFVVSVTDAQGINLVQERTLFVLPSGSPVWCGLTAHGANGVRIWYLDTTVKYVILTRSTNTIIQGSAVAVGPAMSNIDDTFDVVSAGDTYAGLVQHTGSGNVLVSRVNITNGTTSTVTLSGACLGPSGRRFLSISYQSFTAGSYLAVAASSETDGQVTAALYRVSDMANMWTKTFAGYAGINTSGSGTLRGLDYVSQEYIVYAVSTYPTGEASGFETGGVIATHVIAVRLDGTGTYTPITSLPWEQLQSHAATMQFSDTERYPLFFTRRRYDTNAPNEEPDQPGNVDDQSVVVYAVGNIVNVSPVARYGVIRGSLAPCRGPNTSMQSKGSLAIGTKILATYLKDGPGGLPLDQNSFGTRFVELDPTPRQPSIAQDKDGVALVSAALPIQWDGCSVVEMGGPLHRPKLNVEQTGGSADPLAAGIYRFIAVQQWVDSAGLMHRSRPSNQVTLDLDGSEAPIAYVTFPSTMRDGYTQRRMTTVLYVSDVNGTTLHAQTYTATPTGANVISFGAITLPNASTAQVYTTATAGEELPPQPPPPLRDLAIIGSRAWGIDAEIPNRLVYSKYRVSGVGFEWHPAFEVNFPSGAGQLQAVRELNGLPIVITENAIYQIAGEGPDNTGAGGSFGSPVKIADRGCDNRRSVVVSPAGILWQDGSDFVLFSGAGLQVFENMDVSTQVTGAAILRSQYEVIFYSGSDATVYVYNYRVGKWTTWDSQVNPALANLITNVPFDINTVLTYSPSNQILYSLDGESVSDIDNMTWETDWILLGGDFQDHIILRNVIFNGRRLGPHSLKIDVYVDYETSPSTSITWTDAEISPLVSGDRYSIKLELCKQNCRALKLRIQDTTTGTAGQQGVAPRSVTLVYAAQALTFEDAFLSGSYKG